MSVPWHRSLFVRLFAISALVAVVAVAAATWATVRSTTVAVRQEQAQSLHSDATTYDALIAYAATHPSWSSAGPLVSRLAAAAGQAVTVTDTEGRVLLSSSSSPGPRVPAQARAVLDPLDVDAALLSSSTSSGSSGSSGTSGSSGGPVTASAEPAPVAACAGATQPVQCALVVVPSRSSVDPRAVGPFVRDDRAAWSSLQEQVDACLARASLAPVEALGEDFSAVVDYPTSHGRVARCVESSRRAALAPYVAPAALLFVGSGPARPDLLFDLSGPAKLRIALLAGLVLVVSLGLSALLAGYVVRPLRTMAAAAHRAGEGDLTARVASRRTDEVGEVARAFNSMAERREQLEEARRRMVSDVSHELRTPLANVRGWVEAAQDGVATLDARLLESLHEETLHLQRLADDLHDLSLGDAGELRLEPTPIALPAFLSQVAESFSSPQVSVVVPDSAEVVADPVRLRQAVVNLVANALRHTPASGSVVLSGGPGTITVVDTGEGIPAADLPHVFERFRRVDGSRTRATGGTGLGLAIVRQVVEAHGGVAEISSQLGVGTTVTLRFPVAAQPDPHQVTV